MMARRSNYQIRPPPKEVFPESTLSPGGLQLTTLFWDTGILFHQGSHAGARVGNNFEVFSCITTHVSNKSNTPPHPTYWRRIPSPGGSFSLSDPITAFTSTAYQDEYFSQGRAHVPIRRDSDQLVSSENAMRHASEAGLGPVQNGTAPGSPIGRQAGYYRGTGYPSAPMGNSAPQGHGRIPQSQKATTQPMGHDRTGVGGGRNNNNMDVSDRHGSVPLPAGHKVQPIS
ncbi:hypothetical protein B0F90DRAFT_323949 [Multifurca ochricompacta]|uniref:Uncharacterized protein n=1 Tax=Multifurca ochricompacta TaxID=376703 RepID=A0AAD4M5W3_9AGAM|nr:hypothetical protein B0F90DRAFT_323949 [Multifurca ochricompacta]